MRDRADLLDAAGAGIERETLVGTMAELLDAIFIGLPIIVQTLLPGWVQTQLGRLAQLGVVTTNGDTVALTAAGVPAAIGLVRDTGTEVLLRPDPTDCTAAAITDLLGWLELEEWSGDASAWIAAQPDPVAAVNELVAEVCAGRSDPAAVLTGLGLLANLAGENAVTAARRQLGGPHDGLILVWLAERSAIDPTTIDPLRLLAGFVDIFLVTLDDDGPQQAIAFVNQADQGDQLDILDRVWRLQHPRLPELLDVIGAHHPVKSVAKAARKALVRHRSWLANPAAR